MTSALALANAKASRNRDLPTRAAPVAAHIPIDRPFASTISIPDHLLHFKQAAKQTSL
jgi:hypothetical protein